MVRHGGDPIGAWMESEKMVVGDLLETVDGNWRQVTSITPVANEETVYNFTVDKDHDYFVGQTGFLVHNEKCEPCQGHHIVPKFLGGPEEQPLAWIPRSYHQDITTAFRDAAAEYGYGYQYGRPPLDPADLKAILRKVHRQFPLQDAIEVCKGNYPDSDEDF